MAGMMTVVDSRAEAKDFGEGNLCGTEGHKLQEWKRGLDSEPSWWGMAELDLIWPGG